MPGRMWLLRIPSWQDPISDHKKYIVKKESKQTPKAAVESEPYNHRIIYRNREIEENKGLLTLLDGPGKDVYGSALLEQTCTSRYLQIRKT